MKTVVFGIPNCDVTKKALMWLRDNRIPFEFHDYNKSGITSSKLGEWAARRSWEELLNKRGTTWRSIPGEVQRTITNKAAALKLMQEHTSLIKRPVIESGNSIIIGFDENIYRQILEAG